MIKTLQFGDKSVQFSTSFAWTFIYKSQFKRDAARVLMPTIQKIFFVTDGAEAEGEKQEAVQAIVLYEELGFTGIAEIAWAMARLCDKTIPEPLQWIESFGDDFSPIDIVTEVITEAITSCFASKNQMTPPLDQETTTAER